MTNFEKYKDEILSLHEQYQNKGAPALKDGKIVNCNQIHCKECDLNNNEVYCNYTFVRWLYEEADSDNQESESKEVNNNTKRCKDCRHTYKKENEEPCVSCRNRYVLKFEPKLKPCPYCGGKAKEVDLGGDWDIICEDCQSSTKIYPTPKEAMEAWNRRV